MSSKGLCPGAATYKTGGVPAKHKWSGAIPLLEGGWGWHCVRCSAFVTSDDLFSALGTTAWDALQKVEEKWELEARCEEVADAMVELKIG